MLKQLSTAILLLLLISCNQQPKKVSEELNSPNLKNKITFELNDGVASYSVSHREKTVISPSLPVGQV